MTADATLAPCQTEREQFESALPKFWSRETFIDDEGDVLYVEEWVQGAWAGWAMANRRAQAAPQGPALVPLTDEQIQDAIMPLDPGGLGYFLRIARAIEAAHGITGPNGKPT